MEFCTLEAVVTISLLDNVSSNAFSPARQPDLGAGMRILRDITDYSGLVAHHGGHLTQSLTVEQQQMRLSGIQHVNQL